MYRHIQSFFEYSDERGGISGIINFGEWRELNIITSSANCIRGGHYHVDTLELFHIIEGKINVSVCRVDKLGSLFGESKEFLVSKGDTFIIDKMVNHVFNIIEDSLWINGLDHPMDEKNPDLVRPVKDNLMIDK